MRVSESDVTMNFGELFSEPAGKRVERLARWTNRYSVELDVVDDLLRQAYRAGFTKGAVMAKNGINPHELWKLFLSAQKKLED